MTAIAAHNPFAQMNWPRIGALSGSMSLHLCTFALLLTPPIAMQLLKHVEPETPVFVHIIPVSPPEIVPEPLPPVPLHHETHPRVTPRVATIDHVDPPVVAPPTAVSIPAETTPAQTTVSSAMQDIAPSALAYNTRTRVAYPRDSLLRSEHGTVILRVLVGADGLPQTVDIETTSGSPRLDNAARDAVKHWSFKPGTRDGVARSAWARVPVAFDLATF